MDNTYFMQLINKNIAIIEIEDKMNKVKLIKEGELKFEWIDRYIDDSTFIRDLGSKKFTFVNEELKLLTIEKTNKFMKTIKTAKNLIIILSLFLICKTIYQMDTKKSITNSVMYSLGYLLIECSIYWFLNLSSNHEGLYIFKLNIINFIVIFTGIYFFDKLQKFYNNKRYYLYIILTITVNIVVILFFNILEKR